MWRILIQILKRVKQLRYSRTGEMGTIDVLLRILCIIELNIKSFG